MKNGTIISVVLAIIIAGAGWYAYSKTNTNKSASVTSTQKTQQNVVARVNGVDISKVSLDKVIAQLKRVQRKATSTPDSVYTEKIKSSALNALIGQALLKQAVKASGIVATKNEVDKQIDAAKKQFKTLKGFNAVLTAQGMTIPKLRAQFAENLAMQKYLLSKIDNKKAIVTAGEIKAAYDKAVVGVAKPPTLKKSEKSIRAFLTQQKQQLLVKGVVDSLRANAKIEIF